VTDKSGIFEFTRKGLREATEGFDLPDARGNWRVFASA